MPGLIRPLESFISLQGRLPEGNTLGNCCKGFSRGWETLQILGLLCWSLPGRGKGSPESCQGQLQTCSGLAEGTPLNYPFIIPLLSQKDGIGEREVLLPWVGVHLHRLQLPGRGLDLGLFGNEKIHRNKNISWKLISCEAKPYRSIFLNSLCSSPHFIPNSTSTVLPKLFLFEENEKLWSTDFHLLTTITPKSPNTPPSPGVSSVPFPAHLEFPLEPSSLPPG